MKHKKCYLGEIKNKFINDFHRCILHRLEFYEHDPERYNWEREEEMKLMHQFFQEKKIVIMRHIQSLQDIESKNIFAKKYRELFSIFVELHKEFLYSHQKYHVISVPDRLSSKKGIYDLRVMLSQ